jgi:hypothetical protein
MIEFESGGVSLDHFNLFYNGKILKDESKTILYYKIYKESIIHVNFFRMR